MSRVLCIVFYYRFVLLRIPITNSYCLIYLSVAETKSYNLNISRLHADIPFTPLNSSNSSSWIESLIPRTIDFTQKKKKKIAYSRAAGLSNARSCFMTSTANRLISLHKRLLMAPKRDSWSQGPVGCHSR